MGYYGRGDYYRGDYYRGDFWSSLGNVAKRIGTGIADVASGHVVQAVVDVFGSGQSSASPPPPPGPRMLGPGSNLPVAAGPAAGGGGGVMVAQPLGVPPMLALNGTAPRGYHISKKTGKVVRNRRMDVLNVKALRRADRRAHGFLAATRGIVRHYVAKAPKGKAYIHTRRRKKA